MPSQNNRLLPIKKPEKELRLFLRLSVAGGKLFDPGGTQFNATFHSFTVGQFTFRCKRHIRIVNRTGMDIVLIQGLQVFVESRAEAVEIGNDEHQEAQGKSQIGHALNVRLGTTVGRARSIHKAESPHCRSSGDRFSSSLQQLDAGGDFGEHLVEHDPSHEEGQAKVEGLAADVQHERLAALEVVGQFAEVGSKTNGHEGQGEEVAAEGLGDGEHTLVDEGIVEVSTDAASNSGEKDGSAEEADTSIRISLSYRNTKEDIDALIEGLDSGLKKLSRIR